MVNTHQLASSSQDRRSNCDEKRFCLIINELLAIARIVNITCLYQVKDLQMQGNWEFKERLKKKLELPIPITNARDSKFKLFFLTPSDSGFIWYPNC